MVTKTGQKPYASQMDVANFETASPLFNLPYEILVKIGAHVADNAPRDGVLLGRVCKLTHFINHDKISHGKSLNDIINEDGVLQIIWKKVLTTIFKFDGHPPKTLDGIKKWLEDPKNEDQLKKVIRLTLPDSNLNAIPPQITQFAQLQNLDLGDNQIRHLPNFISFLAKLRTFDLNKNKISSLPDSLGKLSKLEWLSLGTNEISSLPDSLSNLSELTTFSLGSNKISSLSDSLSKLTNLKALYLGTHQISSFPDSFSKLTELKILR